MAKPITIYGTITSPYVNRVVMACRRKGLDFQVYLPEGGSKSPEILAINPLGKIPTIKDGRTVLFESGVIVEWLDVKYPKRKLIPAGADAGARVRLLGAMCENYILLMLIRLFVQALNKKPDKAIVADTIKKLDDALDALDQFIQPGPFAYGKSFSAADCYVVSSMIFLERVGEMMGGKDLLGQKRRNIKRYWAAIKRDSIVKETLADIRAFRKKQAAKG